MGRRDATVTFVKVEQNYALCYIRREEGDFEGISVYPAQRLTQQEHDELSDAYSRVRSANHPHLIQMTADFLSSWQTLRQRVVAARQAGQPAAVESLASGARITAFGATNAVYSFEEHLEAQVKRASGGEAWPDAKLHLSAVYDRRPHYFLASKIRRIFTHDTISALKVGFSSSINTVGDTPTERITCTISRNELKGKVTGVTRHWLDSLESDPTLDSLLDETLVGMLEVYPLVRPLLYPDEPADIHLLALYKDLVLNPACPVTLVKSAMVDGQPGPMSFLEIEPDELHSAGMRPLSATELQASTDRAVELLARERSARLKPRLADPAPPHPSGC